MPYTPLCPLFMAKRLTTNTLKKSLRLRLSKSIKGAVSRWNLPFLNKTTISEYLSIYFQNNIKTLIHQAIHQVSKEEQDMVCSSPRPYLFPQPPLHPFSRKRLAFLITYNWVINKKFLWSLSAMLGSIWLTGSGKIHWAWQGNSKCFAWRWWCDRRQNWVIVKHKHFGLNFCAGF